MPLEPNELHKDGYTLVSQKRVAPESVNPYMFAPGSGTIAPLTPLARNSATDKIVVWNPNANLSARQTLTIDGTSGNVTLSVSFGGAAAEVTANIAFNATAAVIEQRLEALGNVIPGSVTVTGGVGASGGGTPYVIAWGDRLANIPITVTVADVDLAGGGDLATIANTVVGAAANGVDRIVLFSWPDPIVLNATDDVQGMCLREGDLHAGDVVLPGGVDLAVLTAALRELRPLQFHVQGVRNPL